MRNAEISPNEIFPTIKCPLDPNSLEFNLQYFKKHGEIKGQVYVVEYENSLYSLDGNHRLTVTSILEQRIEPVILDRPGDMVKYDLPYGLGEIYFVYTDDSVSKLVNDRQKAIAVGNISYEIMAQRYF